MYGAFQNNYEITMAKRRPKAEPLGISPFEARWKRRSPEYSSIQVIELDSNITAEVIRPKRAETGKRRQSFGALTFQDVAVLHLALTRQYQRTKVDSIADSYEKLLAELEDIMENRPEAIRFL
jgi:hypothetical protein